VADLGEGSGGPTLHPPPFYFGYKNNHRRKKAGRASKAKLTPPPQSYLSSLFIPTIVFEGFV